MSRGQSLHTWVILGYGLLAVAAYHLPWHTHSVAAFSNNAFDLAEMVSLHPAVRAESPALYTCLLLRLPLLLLALILLLAAERLKSERWRWLWRAVSMLFVLRLNPPTTFYPHGGGSDNDQQLGKLMIVGLAIAVIVIAGGRRLKRIYHLLVLTALMITLFAALTGFRRATDIMEGGLALELNTGGGFVLFISFTIGAALFTVIDWLLIFRHHQLMAAG
jgi:hypothetical protein